MANYWNIISSRYVKILKGKTMPVTVKVGGVIIGGLYERPDGSIVRTYGWDGEDKIVSFFDETMKYDWAYYEVFKTWKPRQDLRDFPNPSDPLLPYDFDLCWDIQYMSQLKSALFFDHPDKAEILEMMKIHNITLR